jgi:hypothetical protein
VVGPSARLELEREDSAEVLEAEIPAARARALNLKIGETLLIRPRRMQVFVDGARPASDAGTSATAAGAVQDRGPLPAMGTVIW